MDDHFEISCVFEISKFDIAGLACSSVNSSTTPAEDKVNFKAKGHKHTLSIYLKERTEGSLYEFNLFYKNLS